MSLAAIADQECVDPRGKRVEARLCSVRPCHLRSFCSVHQSSAKARAYYPYHLHGSGALSEDKVSEAALLSRRSRERSGPADVRLCGMTSDAAESRNKDGTPRWNGEPSAFQQYEEECLLWVETQPYHKRHMCVPKLKAELTGPAKRLILGQDPSWGAHATGVQELMGFLRQRLGRPQLPELSDLLLKYFRGTKRRAQESVNDYVTRKCEAYVRAQQALRRVLQDRSGSQQKPRHGDYYGHYPGQASGRRSSWDSQTSTGASESHGSAVGGDGDDDESQAAAPTAADAERTNEAWRWDQWNWSSGSWEWGGQASAWWDQSRGPVWSQHRFQTWGRDDTTSESPELLPPFLQGWFLLQDSGLDIHERKSIQTALRGDYDLQKVAAEMRAQWPETELQRRDRQGRQSSYMGEMLEEIFEEENEFECNLADLQDSGMTEEGLVIMDEAEVSAQQALAAIQQGRRTLREARAKQNEVRLSRKYYRPGGTWAANRQQKGGKGQAGRGGRTCPEREAQQSNQATNEEAPFVCFATAPEHIEQALSAGVSTAQAIQEGKAVIDGGATKTIGSVTALEALMRRNQERMGSDGILHVDTSDAPVFSFGNSSTNQCLSTAQVRLVAAGHTGQLKVHTLDVGQGPVLFSIESLRNLGAVIDYEHDLVVFRKLNPEKAIMLERSALGHQLLPLAEDLYKNSVPLKAPLPSLKEQAMAKE